MKKYIYSLAIIVVFILPTSLVSCNSESEQPVDPIETSAVVETTAQIEYNTEQFNNPISREPFSPLTEEQKAHVKAVFEEAFK